MEVLALCFFGFVLFLLAAPEALKQIAAMLMWTAGLVAVLAALVSAVATLLS